MLPPILYLHIMQLRKEGRFLQRQKTSLAEVCVVIYISLFFFLVGEQWNPATIHDVEVDKLDLIFKPFEESDELKLPTTEKQPRSSTQSKFSLERMWKLLGPMLLSDNDGQSQRLHLL